MSDNGEGLTRGVFVRIGDSVGVSYAAGSHIAIQGSSLTQIRRPENAPGRGRGYKRALGIDISEQWAGGVIEFEWVSLSEGVTSADLDMDLTDLKFRFLTRKTNFPITLAWSREWEAQRDWYSVMGEISVSPKLAWQPFVRLQGFGWHDFGLSAKMRL